MTDWEKVCMCEVPHDPSCYHAQKPSAPEGGDCIRSTGKACPGEPFPKEGGEARLCNTRGCAFSGQHHAGPCDNEAKPKAEDLTIPTLGVSSADEAGRGD